jgi:opacity protein-like surface antigen
MRTLVFLCFLIPVIGQGQQNLHLTLYGGFSNYQGDLQGKYFSFEQTNGALGFGLKYDLTARLALRTNFLFTQVGATDATNDVHLRERNLSFNTRIAEGNLMAEYTFFDLNEKRFSPYAFAGLGVFRFNPYAYDTADNKVYLRPLSTEGQGLSNHPDRKPYSLTQFTIPFGAGVKLRVGDNVVIAYELGFRKIFTDYLDDVSKTYVDQAVLASERGQLAVDMAFRTDELGHGDQTYPSDGTIRGGSKFKDWYYTQGITLFIGLNGRDGMRAIRGGQRLSCPTNL